LWSQSSPRRAVQAQDRKQAESIYNSSILRHGPINPIIGAALYERIPREMRARVFGLISAGVLVATPLGGLLAGFLAQQAGLRETLLIYTVIYTIATGSPLFNPSVRELNQPNSTENKTEASPV
jgi:MFS family permease